MRLAGRILTAAGTAGLAVSLVTNMSASLDFERDLALAAYYRPVEPVRASDLEATEARLALADEQKLTQALEDAVDAKRAADWRFLRLLTLSLVGLAAGTALRWAGGRRARAAREGRLRPGLPEAGCAR